MPENFLFFDRFIWFNFLEIFLRLDSSRAFPESFMVAFPDIESAATPAKTLPASEATFFPMFDFANLAKDGKRNCFIS